MLSLISRVLQSIGTTMVGHTDETWSEGKVIKSTSGCAIVEDYSLEWKIENFLVIKSFNDLIDEQRFNFEAGESHGYLTKWRLQLQKQPDKELGIFLNLKKAPPNCRTIVNCLFRTIKQNGESCKPKRLRRKLFTPKSGFGFTNFFPEDDEDLEQVIWEDCSVVIKVNLEMFLFKPAGLPKGKGLQAEKTDFEKRELEKMSFWMKQMIELGNQQEAGKIIKILSEDQVEFYANTATISARSPVFKVMFESGKWKEGQSSEGGDGGGCSLVLKDLSGKTVKVLLHFLIGGVLLEEEWKAEEVILELTYAAEKYHLEGLTEFLDKVLPEITYGTETLAKLALLTKRLGMKHAEKGLFTKLKKAATDIDQLLLDKEGSLFGSD